MPTRIGIGNNSRPTTSTFPDLRVVLRDPQPQAIIPRGAGRLLSLAYLAGGRYVGKKFGRLAHEMGYGPDAASERVRKRFENKAERLSELANLRRGEVDHSLRKNCLELMAYTLPAETPLTQLRAFKNIVTLVTRFPGLRHVFISCRHLRAAGTSKPHIVELWQGSNNVFGETSEWTFFLEFAVSCICDEDKLACVVESSELDILGLIAADTGQYSVIEELLVATSSW
jgi:hypothetical protein